MHCHLYLRKGTVFIPTLGSVNRGLYRDVEPVAVVPASDADGIRRALRATIDRGNPPTPPYQRDTCPQPVVLKHAGVRSWHAFARGTRPWVVKEKDGTYQIVGHQRHPDGWGEDPDQVIKFRRGTSIDEVVERMIAILQDAAQQQ